MRTNLLEQVEMLRRKKNEFDESKKKLKAARNDKETKDRLNKKCKDLKTSVYQKLDNLKMVGYLDKQVIKGKEVDLEKVNESVLESFKSKANKYINDEITRLQNEVRGLEDRLKTRESHRAVESNPRALAFTLEVLNELPADTHEVQEAGGDGRYWILQQNGVQYEKEED